MEPLNLMVSLIHFGNEKSTLPPKQPKRRRRAATKRDTAESRTASTTRRAIRWLRTAVAR